MKKNDDYQMKEDIKVGDYLIDDYDGDIIKIISKKREVYTIEPINRKYNWVHDFVSIFTLKRCYKRKLTGQEIMLEEL